mmetsp:Transcript_77113/g.170764  ORF Transcript_77113/g.170764 Transcript_77113/m.170764 type:complete len:222 (-) Transcript_77113:953-1618(-)
MSLSREASVLTRPVCFSSRSSLVFSPTLTLSSVLSISWLQRSFFSYSCFCCCSSSLNILSMASFTLVKASRRTWTASEAKAQLPVFLATCVRRSIARCEARSWAATTPVTERREELTCIKLIVFPNRSRASSAVRIFKASPRARISSPRTWARDSYSCFSASQFLARSIMNLWSAPKAVLVASMSSFALAAWSRRSASEASFVSICSVAAAISESFAERSC